MTEQSLNMTLMLGHVADNTTAFAMLLSNIDALRGTAIIKLQLERSGLRLRGHCPTNPEAIDPKESVSVTSREFLMGHLVCWGNPEP